MKTVVIIEMFSQQEEDISDLEVGECCYCGEECNPMSQSCGICSRSMTMNGFSSKTGSRYFYRPTIDVLYLVGDEEKGENNVTISGIEGNVWVGDPSDLDVDWNGLDQFSGMVKCQLDDEQFIMYIFETRSNKYVVRDYCEKRDIIGAERIVFIPERNKNISKFIREGKYSDCLIHTVGDCVRTKEGLSWGLDLGLYVNE